MNAGIFSKENQTGAIYRIAHHESGRYYIGQAVNPRKRWTGHRSKLRRNEHDNAILQNLVNRDGLDSLTFEVIGRFSRPLLNMMEQLLINLKWSDAQCANLAKSVTKPPLQQGERSLELRVKIRATLKNESFTDAAYALSERSKVKAGLSKMEKEIFKAGVIQYLKELQPLLKFTAQESQQIPEYSGRIQYNVSVRHDDGRTDVIDTAPAFARRHGIRRRYVTHLLRGEKPSVAGWRLASSPSVKTKQRLEKVGNGNSRVAKGYYWHKRDKCYHAKIKRNGKVQSLGYFKTEGEAHRAYQLARIVPPPCPASTQTPTEGTP